jgi:hypothetical protein
VSGDEIAPEGIYTARESNEVDISDVLCASYARNVFRLDSCRTCWSLAQHSVAALLTLTDDNSVSEFDTTTQANNFDWIVDGTDLLAQQAFWYRIGNVPEKSLHILPIAVQGVSDSNFDGNMDTLFVRYTGAGFRADTR